MSQADYTYEPEKVYKIKLPGVIISFVVCTIVAVGVIILFQNLRSPNDPFFAASKFEFSCPVGQKAVQKDNKWQCETLPVTPTPTITP